MKKEPLSIILELLNNERFIKSDNSETTIRLLNSFMSQIAQDRTLSQKQIALLDRLTQEQENSSSWEEEYKKEKQHTAMKIAQWYSSGCGMPENPDRFYIHLSAKILAGEVPGQTIYNKLMNNPYVLRFLAILERKQEFKQNDIVVPRKSAARHFKLPCDYSFVVDYLEFPTSSSWMMRILPVGGTKLLVVSETSFKKYNNKTKKV